MDQKIILDEIADVQRKIVSPIPFDIDDESPDWRAQTVAAVIPAPFHFWRRVYLQLRLRRLERSIGRTKHVRMFGTIAAALVLTTMLVGTIVFGVEMALRAGIGPMGFFLAWIPLAFMTAVASGLIKSGRPAPLDYP